MGEGLQRRLSPLVHPLGHFPDSDQQRALRTVLHIAQRLAHISSYQQQAAGEDFQTLRRFSSSAVPLLLLQLQDAQADRRAAEYIRLKAADMEEV